MVDLIVCDYCRNSYKRKERRCPHCGAKKETSSKRTMEKTRPAVEREIMEESSGSVPEEFRDTDASPSKPSDAKDANEDESGERHYHQRRPVDVGDEINVCWLVFWIVVFWPAAIVYVVMKKT